MSISYLSSNISRLFINYRTHFGRPFYFLNLIIYALFVVALTAYVITVEGFYNAFHNGIQFKGFEPSNEIEGQPVTHPAMPSFNPALMNITAVRNLNINFNYTIDITGAFMDFLITTMI